MAYWQAYTRHSQSWGAQCLPQAQAAEGPGGHESWRAYLDDKIKVPKLIVGGRWRVCSHDQLVIDPAVWEMHHRLRSSACCEENKSID